MIRLFAFFLGALVMSLGANSVVGLLEAGYRGQTSAVLSGEEAAKNDRSTPQAQSAATDFLKRAEKYRPTKPELAWQQIPWVTVRKNGSPDELESLKEAFRQARREKRPVLIWSPDGSPFDQC